MAVNVRDIQIVREAIVQGNPNLVDFQIIRESIVLFGPSVPFTYPFKTHRAKKVVHHRTRTNFKLIHPATSNYYTVCFVCT